MDGKRNYYCNEMYVHINPKKQEQLLKLIAHALNSTTKSHKIVDIILKCNIKLRLPKKENE